jgi:hypothetical protein
VHGDAAGLAMLLQVPSLTPARSCGSRQADVLGPHFEAPTVETDSLHPIGVLMQILT